LPLGKGVWGAKPPRSRKQVKMKIAKCAYLSNSREKYKTKNLNFEGVLRGGCPLVRGFRGRSPPEAGNK